MTSSLATLDAGSTTLLWMEQRNCQGVDPEIFFSTEPRVRAQAIAVCRSCPVLEQCHARTARLEAEFGTMYGIFAGLTRGQRRRRNRRPNPTCRHEGCDRPSHRSNAHYCDEHRERDLPRRSRAAAEVPAGTARLELLEAVS